MAHLPPAQPPEQSADEAPAADPAAGLTKPPADQAQRPSAQPSAHAPSRPTGKARGDRPADPAHQQRSVAALFLALLSLLGLLGLTNFQRGRYIVGFALVVGVLAVWFAVTAIIRARRRGTARPRASVTATVIGAIGVLLSGLLLAGFAMFGPQVTHYSQCLSGANTISAQQSCQHQFIQGIENATP